MLEANVAAALAGLGPSDLVLDVGGWACPFNRAQWVLDAEPFETRGFYRSFGGPAFQGPAEEWFSRHTWVQRDICDHEPWPFEAKQFDFVVCSHTLEDIRDPVWVCKELMRVGKRGYIEVPSRHFESCLGVERPGQAGLSHHRWLIDIADGRMDFLHKFHLIHADWRCSLPSRYRRHLSPTRAVQWLWWEDRFEVREVTIHGADQQADELMRFAQGAYPRSRWRFEATRVSNAIRALPGRALGWMRRHR